MGDCEWVLTALMRCELLGCGLKSGQESIYRCRSTKDVCIPSGRSSRMWPCAASRFPHLLLAPTTAHSSLPPSILVRLPSADVWHRSCQDWQASLLVVLLGWTRQPGSIFRIQPPRAPVAVTVKSSQLAIPCAHMLGESSFRSRRSLRRSGRRIQ